MYLYIVINKMQSHFRALLIYDSILLWISLITTLSFSSKAVIISVILNSVKLEILFSHKNLEAFHLGHDII